MFLRYFGYARIPFPAALEKLREDAARWMPDVVEQAYETGNEARIRIGLGSDHSLAKQARVLLGDMSTGEQRALLPLRIEATGPTSLFPRMEADLEVSAFGDDLTQVTLSGSYEPPLGSFGELADRMLLHHVAEAAVKRLVDQITVKLSERPPREHEDAGKEQSGPDGR